MKIWKLLRLRNKVVSVLCDLEPIRGQLKRHNKYWKVVDSRSIILFTTRDVESIDDNKIKMRVSLIRYG